MYVEEVWLFSGGIGTLLQCAIHVYIDMQESNEN